MFEQPAWIAETHVPHNAMKTSSYIPLPQAPKPPPGPLALGCIQLMRPANVVTAWADVLAGAAIAGVSFVPVLSPPYLQLPSEEVLWPLFWLMLSTTGLYGGGIVFNDVFDAELDAEERPERPIPRGSVPCWIAIGFGIFLLSLGVIAALQVSWACGVVALLIAGLALYYDALAKSSWLAPVVMGSCRAGNFLLGISIITAIWAIGLSSAELSEIGFLLEPESAIARTPVALIPWVYILAITVISQGEVANASRKSSMLACLLMVGVASALSALCIVQQQWWGLGFVIFLLYRIGPAFWRSLREATPEAARQAVRAGVLSLIVLDSAIAASFADWLTGLVILALLSLSTRLAHWFSVT